MSDDQLMQLLLNRRREPVTVLVAYAPRPEGQAALDKGIEIAKQKNERLVVVNAIKDRFRPHIGTYDDPSRPTVGE